MNTQDLPETYHKSTPGIPHQPKKRTLPGLPGLFGITNRVLGRVVHMPWVPDARVGCAGGISGRAGYVNICKQSPESMLGVLTCC